MRKLNESPYALAVPLDFTRFSCTGDLLHIERDPESGPRTSIIEVKEGPVNDAILDAAKARDEGAWAQFFDDYGKKGFEQARRFFKQNREYFKRADRMKATAGLHEDEDGPRVVLESDIPLESYHDVVQALCNRARKGSTPLT